MWLKIKRSNLYQQSQWHTPSPLLMHQLAWWGTMAGPRTRAVTHCEWLGEGESGGYPENEAPLGLAAEVGAPIL